MNTTYVFKMRGDNLLIAEDAGGRKKWEPCAIIERAEGKSADSNRQRKGWRFVIIADEFASLVYKGKGDAKTAAEDYCLALLSGETAPKQVPVETPRPGNTQSASEPTGDRALVSPEECAVSFGDLVRPKGTTHVGWVVKAIERIDWQDWRVTAQNPNTGQVLIAPLVEWEVRVQITAHQWDWIHFGA